MAISREIRCPFRSEDEHGKRELTARKKAGLWDLLAMKTSGLIGY